MRRTPTPIRRTLMNVLLLTSGAVMLTTCLAFGAYDYLTYRRQTLHNLGITLTAMKEYNKALEYYREALVLRELEGLSYKEIADITDVPVGTVMSRLARARKRLHIVLASHKKEV